MTLFTLPSAQSSTPQRRSDRKFAVSNLQEAAGNMIRHIRRQPRWTKAIALAEEVGPAVTDIVNRLDGRALAVLCVVIDELERDFSKKRDRQW